MKVFEFKMYGSVEQFVKVDESFRTVQFIRNKCIALWMAEGQKPKGERKFGDKEMSRMSAVLAQEFAFCKKLNSMARQESAERAAFAVQMFYKRCKNPSIKKKGYPKFQDDCRSVEYKTSGWKFSSDFKHITFTDKTGVGTFALRGGYVLDASLVRLIKRVRIVKKCGLYYLQVVCGIVDATPEAYCNESAVAYDLGLKEFAVDQNGNAIHNNRFLKKSLKKLKRLQRSVSRKKKGGKNRKKAIKKLAIGHGKVANQRKDFAVKLARSVVMSNDVVVFEDLSISKMAKGMLSRSIHDVGWGVFLKWINHFSNKYGNKVIFVNPNNTTQMCSACGSMPHAKLGLNVRTYHCEHCGMILDRDQNAAINILAKAIPMVHEQIATAGHAESWSYILHCLNKAMQNARLQYVFGEMTSGGSASADTLSQLNEKETTDTSKHTKVSKYILKSLEIV